MYLSHFHLDREPFSLTPDPRFLFLGERHREALAHLLYGLQRSGGFVQLTGEVGTGKTTLCRTVLEQVPAGVDVALVLNPRLTAPELVATVCDELGVTYPAGAESIKVLVDALNAHLLEGHARGRRTVLIVDEAQQLSAAVLEQVRLLTNLETSSTKLLQIVLIGQPELQTLMARPELRQLAQRITARYHLGTLSRNEVAAYVRHRLEVAGRVAPLFTAAALRRIHRLSGGVPRLINVTCDRALLGAYGEGAERVGSSLVGRAAAEVRGEKSRRRRWIPALVGLTFLTAATGAGAWAWRFWLRSAGPPERHPAPAGFVGSGAAVPRGESEEDAFRALMARWALHYGNLQGTSPCDRAASAGLRCLEGVGGWDTLRRFDLPAVIELADGAHRTHAVVTALEGERVTLRWGGQTVVLSAQEAGASWTGRYKLLWRPPPFEAELLRVGGRGRPVLWLRDRLDRLEPGPGGVDPGAPREIFDSNLLLRVRAFQRRHGLRPDGMVGVQTAIQLSRAAGDAPVPSLARGS